MEPIEFLRHLQAEELPFTVTGRANVVCVEMLNAVDFVRAVIISREFDSAEARVEAITWLGRSALDRKR